MSDEKPLTEEELAEFERDASHYGDLDMDAVLRLVADVRRLRALVYEHHAVGIDHVAGTVCPVCLKHDPETRAIWGKLP